MSEAYAPDIVARIREKAADPVWFISNLTITLKNGTRARFGDVMLPEQLALLDILLEHQQVLVVKARQMGLSTMVRAYQLWRAFTASTDFAAAIVSNKERHSDKILNNMDARFLKSMPDVLQWRASAGVIRIQTADDTESTIEAFSGAALDDRGYTFQSIHFTEFSFMENASDVLATMGASTTGQIIIESSPSAYGDAMHKLIQNRNRSDAWKVVFLPWMRFPEYRRPVPVGFAKRADEVDYQIKHDLTDEQLAWRRWKMESLNDDDRFRREFPATIDEAYDAGEAAYFTGAFLSKLVVLREPGTVSVRKEVLRFREPDETHRFVVGVDPAQGVRRDRSVAYIIDATTMRTAAVIRSDRLTISAFSELVSKVATEYRATCLVEQNNHGHAVIEAWNAMRFHDYEVWPMTVKTKLQMFDVLRTTIAEGLIEDVEGETLDEMRQLLKHPKDLAPSHPDDPDAHDDHVIAFGLALVMARAQNLVEAVSQARGNRPSYADTPYMQRMPRRQSNPSLPGVR